SYIRTSTPRPTPTSPLSPYTTLFRSESLESVMDHEKVAASLAELGNEHRLSVFRFLVKAGHDGASVGDIQKGLGIPASTLSWPRSEEHTSELQSRFDLVCRLLLEKKK